MAAKKATHTIPESKKRKVQASFQPQVKPEDIHQEEEEMGMSLELPQLERRQFLT